MEHLIHADIFFFISSIGFIIIGLLMAVALVYLIRILRAASRVTAMIERQAGAIGEEAKEFILDVRQSRVYSFLFGRSMRRRK